MTLLGHLADGFFLELGRISWLAHGTPPVGSILASEVSTIPGEVQEGVPRSPRADQRRSYDFGVPVHPNSLKALAEHGPRRGERSRNPEGLRIRRRRQHAAQIRAYAIIEAMERASDEAVEELASALARAVRDSALSRDRWLLLELVKYAWDQG